MSGGTERLAPATAATRTDAERAIEAARLAQRLASVGRLAEAQQAATEATRHAEAAGEHRSLAAALHANALVRYRADDYPVAMRQLDSAMHHAEEAADERMQAAVLATAGNVLAHLGDPIGAIKRLTRALGLAECVGDAGEIEHEAYLGLARVYARIDEPERADVFAHRALSTALKREDKAAIVAAQRMLGNVFASETERRSSLDLPNHDEGRWALEWYDKALHGARELGDRVGEVLVVNNIAHVLRFLGREREAVATVQEVLAQGGEGISKVILALLYFNLGDAWLRLGEPELALEVLPDALWLAEESQSSEHLPKMHLALADAYERLGDIHKALDHHKAYYEVERKLRGQRIRSEALFAAARLEKAELTQESHRYRKESSELARELDSLADRAAVLGSQARRDSLTGLPNRLAFDEWLDSVVDKEKNVPVSVALLDLDQFKSINDRFSHLVGDEVLRRVARLMATTVRQGDLVARYGGEEFGMVLPATSLGEAAAVCERVREAIAKANWRSVRAELDVTVSIGVAEETSAQQALSVADRRLYVAKRGGRNRVVAC